ncbi:hypothetical protein A8713_30960 [Streptomyces sp. SAT1]|uniref:hypothetical protein n=1 Tax=Streptomyces sp. SAT1 TaxID=1849967 RepID=UPI0007DD9900|nr:hypothetical protein [Streptomyces sp. SAT1]ANH95042.1 hypothetical protein A8713_30960 [Streptomyces sp. SAT1]
MRTLLRTATLSAALTLAAGGLVAGAATTASAAGKNCDAGSKLDAYGVVGGGSSYAYAGRNVQLLNGRTRNYTHGQIISGYHRGDRTWVDRSRNKMPKTPKHPSTALVKSHGGWKQCGPFNSSTTDSVINWDTSKVRHYAVRVCIDPAGSKPYHCGVWYTDAS